MDALGILKWFGTVVIIAIAVNIVSNLLSPNVSDWLANASGKRAHNKVCEIQEEEKLVRHLVRAPYELALWASYGLLRAVLWFLGAMLLACVGLAILVATRSFFPAFYSASRSFFSGHMTVMDFCVIGLASVVALIISRCIARIRMVARLIFAVSHHERYLPEIEARRNHYWNRSYRRRG